MQKKYFVIFVTFLLLVMTAIPAVNSEQNYIKTNETSFDDCDLGITFDNCELNALVSPSKPYTKVVLTYRLEVIITNNGAPFSGDVLINLNTLGTYSQTLSWELNGFVLDSGGEFSHSFYTEYLNSGQDPEYDQERYIGGKLAVVELDVIDHNDINLDNNVDEGAIRHWLGKNTLPPTTAQIDVCSPHSYRIITDENGLNYIETFFDYYDLELDFPDILKNNRMGWVFKLGLYLHVIVKDIRKIILEHVEFALVVSAILTAATACCESVFLFCEAVTFGIPWAEPLEILLIWWFCVEPALEALEQAAQGWGESVKQRVQKFKDDCEEFKLWWEESPWNNPILVEGKVTDLKNGELITISCRDFSDTFFDDDDGINDNAYSYSFYVTADPKYDKHNRWCRSHDCTVSVTGSEHNGKFETRPIFSWVFSDGKLRTGNVKLSRNRNIDLSIIDLILTYLSRFPVMYELFRQLVY